MSDALRFPRAGMGLVGCWLALAGCSATGTATSPTAERTSLKPSLPNRDLRLPPAYNPADRIDENGAIPSPTPASVIDGADGAGDVAASNPDMQGSAGEAGDAATADASPAAEPAPVATKASEAPAEPSTEAPLPEAVSGDPPSGDTAPTSDGDERNLPTPIALRAGCDSTLALLHERFEQ